MKTTKQPNNQTNNIRRRIVFFFMSFTLCFMQSCSTEDQAIEQQSNIETVSKNEAITFVKNLYDEQRTTAKSSGLQNDFDFDKITQEKLTSTIELLTVIPIKTKIQNQRRRALFLRVGANIESMIYHEFAESSFTNDTFSGIVLMTRLNGEFIRAYRLKNNKYVVDLVPAKKIKSGQKAIQHTSRSMDGSQLDEVVVYNYYKDPSSFVSLNEMGKEVPITISWNSLGSGGDPDPDDDEELDFKINSDELNGKAKCINDLLNKKDSSYVKSLLSNFEGESEFNIKIVSQDVIISNVSGKPINGSTTEPVNSVIVIKISTSQANLNPNLVVARTILHEYIHADIYRKLKTNNASLPEIQDFKKIFELYADNLDKDHSAMADLYLNSMIAALKEFHKMQLPNDYNAYINYYGEEPNDAFYEGLAWVGLKDNNVDAWVKLSEAKKEEIKNMGSRIDKLGKISPCTN